MEHTIDFYNLFHATSLSIMDYSISRFSSSHASTDSDMTALPSTSLPRTKLETAFCRNYKCCGQGLKDLHDLLQHYEERHVKFEEDDMPAMVTDDGNSASSSSASSSQPPSPKSIDATKADVKNDTFEESSAFDTTVMRSSPVKGGKKRSFGQFSNGNSNSSVHQSLRRALIDGGVGRGDSSKASSIYSANSPFSTPGSSIPGTPTMDNDRDTGFFGNGNSIPAFSSLSIRGSGDDHDLPSCAPPNLFFPSSGTSSSTTVGSIAPPTKRERISSVNSAVSSGTLENSLNSPGALGDRPYKCQSPGCDKAYKQMNGLKYHRLHGQCNQNNIPGQESTATDKASGSSDNASASTSASVTNGAAAVAAAIAAAAASSGSDNVKLANNTIKAAPASASVATAATTVAAPVNTTANVAPTPLATVISSESDSTSPSSSAPGSPRSSSESIHGEASKVDRVYICQVGSCGKRYKNLNGLRYHYLHSGSHGLLGLQLLSSNGGGASARADVNTGRPAISTNDLSNAALAAAAQAAAARQQANQRTAAMQKQDQQEQKQEINLK